MKRNTLVKQSVAGLMLAAFIGGALPAMAGDTVNQTVNITVDEIQEISTSGAASLHITTAVPGAAPTTVTDTTTTYSITSNDGTKKITAAINTDMPSGMVLSVTVVAPSASGTSAGKKSLSTVAADVVTSITKVSDTQMLTYELSATAAAGKLAATTRTVTFTIAAGS